MVNNKMKKMYFQPICIVVALGTCHMMAESLIVNTSQDAPQISNSSAILTKENNDVNVWDEEW